MLAAVVWVATRAFLLWLLAGPQEWVIGDVAYFDVSMLSLPSIGLAHTLVEYPLPAVAVVGLPWELAHRLGDGGAYGSLMKGIAVLVDLSFTLLLARTGRKPLATWAWILGVPLLGATAYARFDLFPGVLTGTAVLLLATRPKVAAGCVAVATAIKYWPVLTIPPLLARARPRAPAVAVVAAVGVVLAGATVLLAGWERLLTPMSYQGDRGLQIESVLGTPAMIAWLLHPVQWLVVYAPSKSYEVVGPGVEGLLVASRALTFAYVVALALAWWRLWVLRDRLSPATMVWLVLSAVTGFVVVGKVYSPQYLLWLLPVAAAGLAVADSARLRGWTAGLLVAAGLTQLVFPMYYGEITLQGDRPWLAVLPLVARNLITVLLLVTAVRTTWEGLRDDAQRGSALDRQPPGPACSEERTSR